VFALKCITWTSKKLTPAWKTLAARLGRHNKHLKSIENKYGKN